MVIAAYIVNCSLYCSLYCELAPFIRLLQFIWFDLIVSTNQVLVVLVCLYFICSICSIYLYHSFIIKWLIIYTCEVKL